MWREPAADVSVVSPSSSTSPSESNSEVLLRFDLRSYSVVRTLGVCSHEGRGNENWEVGLAAMGLVWRVSWHSGLAHECRCMRRMR